MFEIPSLKWFWYSTEHIEALKQNKILPVQGFSSCCGLRNVYTMNTSFIQYCLLYTFDSVTHESAIFEKFVKFIFKFSVILYMVKLYIWNCTFSTAKQKQKTIRVFVLDMEFSYFVVTLKKFVRRKIRSPGIWKSESVRSISLFAHTRTSNKFAFYVKFLIT